MDMTKLKYFIAAADCGSFTDAARSQFTSQPNISKQISSLEEKLGAKLFLRGTRSVKLTKAGEYLYEQTKELPERLERVFETTRALGRVDMGELTIGLLTGQYLNRDLIESFKSFSIRYPTLNYSLERASFRALRDSLYSFRYDMIITLSFDIEDSAELIVEPIKKQQGAVFVSRMSPMSDVEDFSKVPFVAISPKESYGGYQQLMRFGEQNGFVPNIVRMADSLDSLLFYVETGIGVTVLDRNTRFEADRNIRVIPVADSEASELVAVWLRSSKNDNIRKMADCLQGR